MYKQIGRWLDPERTLHSLKTVIACFIGLLIIHLFHFPSGQWIVITILVVMCAQINVGSLLQKSKMRFLGTLLGATLAIGTLWLFGNQLLPIVIALVLAGFIFSYLATSNKSYSDAGTLGAATTTLILISPEPTIYLGFERCLEIIIGIVIATLVSQFIFPIRAHKHLRYSQASMLRYLKDYYQTTFEKKFDTASFNKLEQSIIKNLTTQRKLVGEALVEGMGFKSDNENLFSALEIEKQILRAISLMNSTYHSEVKVTNYLNQFKELKRFHNKMVDTFENFITILTQRKLTPITMPQLDLKKLKLSELSDFKEKKLVYTFIYALQDIQANFKDLYKLLSSNPRYNRRK